MHSIFCSRRSASSQVEIHSETNMQQFVRLSEQKINSCLPPVHPLDREPDIEKICGAGADGAFDKLIGSLGRLAVLSWRSIIIISTQDLLPAISRSQSLIF